MRQSSQELAGDIEKGLNDLSGRIPNLTSILKEQGRLRAVTAQQTVISELLEIPALGRTLIRQHYYTEVFELFEFVNKLRSQIGGEFTERLSQEISRLKEDAKTDMIKQLTDCVASPSSAQGPRADGRRRAQEVVVPARQ